MWLIEPAGLDFSNTALSAIDLNTNEFIFRFEFPKGEAKFAQDLRITSDGKRVIIADTGFFKFTAPGLIVFDVERKSYRTFLARHDSARPQNWIIKGPLGEHHLGFGLLGFFVGIDGIEISADQKWLIYASMTHDSLYRLPMSVLLANDADDRSVSKAVEYLGQKTLSDGITQLTDEKIVLTDIENGGLSVFDFNTKKSSTLIRSKNVIWADGVSNYSDAALVFTDSSIPAYIDQLARPPSLSVLEKNRPYRIYKLDLR